MNFLVKFRANLESAIAKKFNKCSIVVLVVGGGPRTIEGVYEALKQGTPCVFLEV